MAVPERDDPVVDDPDRPAPRHLARRLVDRLALLGVKPDDSDDVRTKKATLTFATSIVTALALVWVATYLALGLPRSAAIPFAYQVLSVVGLILFARTKAYRPFRFTQIVMLLFLPFLLQWSLGGYAVSSAVSLWALVAVLGALFFYPAREAVPWFVAFIALTVLSGLGDPIAARSAASIPTEVIEAFFVLNIIGVSLTAYLLLLYFVRERDAAMVRSEGLLLNVLPGSIVKRLKREPGLIADRSEDVTVLFADVEGFTRFAEATDPGQVVRVLDDIFSAFDVLTERHGLEKIKTIGDAYMVVGGLPEPRIDHAEAVAELALDMLDEMARLRDERGLGLKLRIGLDTGPVVAGVIGRRKFSYDLWGDTVNTASRMESHGIAGRVQTTEATYRRLSATYRFDERGEIDVKGKGRLRTYLLAPRGEEPRLPG